MKVSVILPIYNEEEILIESLTDIIGKMKKSFSVFEIIAVDDGSNDGTKSLLKGLKKKYKSIFILTHKKNKGYGSVLKSGILKAKYEWIFFTDADLQFNILELKKFLPFQKKYDFIIGYRKKRAEGLRRRTISHAYNKIIRFMFGLKVKDVDCAFKLMKKSALKQIDLKSDSFFVSCELMVRAARKAYSIKELPVTHYRREKGESKVTILKIIKTINDLVSLYTII